MFLVLFEFRLVVVVFDSVLFLCSFTQAVSSLVAEMATALELHSNAAVLEAAARTFLTLCEEGTAWCSVAQDTRDSLILHWVDQLTQLLNDSLVVCLLD